MFEVGKKYSVLKGFYDMSGFISDSFLTKEGDVIDVLECGEPGFLGYFNVKMHSKIEGCEKVLMMDESWERHVFENHHLEEIKPKITPLSSTG